MSKDLWRAIAFFLVGSVANFLASATAPPIAGYENTQSENVVDGCAATPMVARADGALIDVTGEEAATLTGLRECVKPEGSRVHLTTHPR
jgi:hypothetical protein